MAANKSTPFLGLPQMSCAPTEWKNTKLPARILLC